MLKPVTFNACVAVLGDKQLNRAGRVEKTELVLPKYKMHILPFVPALNIKECQKLINISKIGVCVCVAVLVWCVPGAWSFYSLRETGDRKSVV